MENKPIYKTAEELGIKQWEHDGLVALVGPLSRGELAYDQGEYVMPNSSCVECGTALCIGGWLAFNAGKNSEEYVDSHDDTAGYNTSLSALFWGYTGSDPSGRQGAQAIVNFLVTGDPQWDAVMAEG